MSQQKSVRNPKIPCFYQRDVTRLGSDLSLLEEARKYAQDQGKRKMKENNHLK